MDPNRLTNDLTLRRFFGHRPPAVLDRERATSADLYAIEQAARSSRRSPFERMAHELATIGA